MNSKLLWFVGLYVASVMSVATIAYAIRAALHLLT